MASQKKKVLLPRTQPQPQPQLTPKQSSKKRYIPFKVEENPISTARFPMIEALMKQFPLFIFYSGKAISPETKLLVEEIEAKYKVKIRIYTLGKWHYAFEDMHTFIQKCPLETLETYERQIAKIIHTLTNREITQKFELFKDNSKIKLAPPVVEVNAGVQGPYFEKRFKTENECEYDI